MKKDNICHFVPYHKDYNSIHTINYVFETEQQQYTSLKSEAVYKIYYVYSGKGFLHRLGSVEPLEKGDIFFTFPGSPFCIQSEEDFSYMYISFLGSRANMIVEKLKISPNNFIFKNCDEAVEVWEKGFSTPSELTDLISESIVLYTFSYLGTRLISFDNKEKNPKTALLIKKYIDDNFSNTALTIKSISRELSYNKKYISTVFKKDIGIGISEYLSTIRIQNACTLMNQGFTSICDIALCSGFADSNYFSKVFKQKMGKSPRDYIKNK